jgi:hypothetical protein
MDDLAGAHEHSPEGMKVFLVLFSKKEQAALFEKSAQKLS